MDVCLVEVRTWERSPDKSVMSAGGMDRKGGRKRGTTSATQRRLKHIRLYLGKNLDVTCSWINRVFLDVITRFIG